MKILDLKKIIVRILAELAGISLTSRLTYSQCTAGSYNRCFRVGALVILSFNINVTTATSGYAYIRGMPPAIEGNWGCSGDSNTTGISRWYVSTEGYLRCDGTPVTGWHNGNVAYICDLTNDY